MKKIAILFIALSSLFLSNYASATSDPTKDPITSNNTVPVDTAAQLKVLELRLNEIKEMDKSALTRSEKKELKSEVKEIKKEMKALSGGVYISAGALIVILILLIILL
jgi:hypothetical protein